MGRIGMGLVGPGFVAAHHIDAVRRLGFVDVVAVASSTLERARAKADQYGIPKAYGSYQELAADPDVKVVHNTTPNYLHSEVIKAALSNRKHIISDKPLAINSIQARELWKAAQQAGVVHAVLFNYRGNPAVQQARHLIASGDLGPVYFIHGAYLQDWLLEANDYSWRLDPEKGGASAALADIGSHWCDLAQHVTGLRIEAVLADLTTVVQRRQRPTRSGEAFAAHSDGELTEEVHVTSEDLASVLLRFENGAKGSFSVGQVCAGHKNDLWVEVDGRRRSLRWNQELQDDLWIGNRHEASQVLPKDPALYAASARRYARLPGGHHEGWADALFNVIRDIYAAITKEPGSGAVPSPLVATFEDGYRINRVIDTLLESSAAGNVWKTVDYS